MMIVEQMLNNAPRPLLHIADGSGSALFQGDCLDIMPLIPDNSINCIITDPPYGTTTCKWDSVIPFDKMWEQLNRIIKPNGAIVLFGNEPFSSALRMSNIKNYKYDWKWEKGSGSNYAAAKFQPLRLYEDVMIFSNKTSVYNPQMTLADPKNFRISGKSKKDINEINGLKSQEGKPSGKYKYPLNKLVYNKNGKECNSKHRKHPAQKPVALLEYLIKTYTNEGETVLDFTMGSGSTGVACKNLNRKFIGIEKEPKYYKIACQRCGF